MRTQVKRVRYVKPVSFARFFTQRQFYLFHHGQISFLRPFKNDRQVFNAVFQKKAFLFLALFYHRKEKYFFYFLSYELYLLCFIFRRASSASLKVIFLSGLWKRRERRIRLWSGASVFWKIASLCFCIHFSLADA